MERIQVDLLRTVGDVSRDLFGGHIEHNKRRVYGGLYDPASPLADAGGLRSDVKDGLIGLGVTNLRYPGGNFASGYRWRDGVGPRAERPARPNLAWGGVESNEFGTDEFIGVCRKLGVAPYLCVNCGDGDMREAGDWVDYCNSSAPTALARLREKNGSSEPHAVRYWGIGNEVDSPTQTGAKTPVEYARAAAEFAKVMKRVDPSIKLIASGVRTWEDHPRVLARELGDETSEWVERAQQLLELAGLHIDYVALHRYVYPRMTDSFEECMLGTEAVEKHLTAYEGLLSALALNRGLIHPVHIAFDEWGAEPRGQHDDLEVALVTALYFNIFLRHAHTVRIANFNPMMRSVLPVQTEKEFAEVLPQSTYHAFRLYRETYGPRSLDVHWEGSTLSGTYMGSNYAAVRTLDVAATLDPERKRLVLYVVNRSGTDDIEAHISLADGTINGGARVRTLTGAGPAASNTFEEPDAVQVSESSLDTHGKVLTHSFEKHSLTVIEAAVA